MGPPQFEIAPDSIRILKSPSEFRREIYKLIKSSTQEISLACLYVGDPTILAELAEQIRSKPILKVNILVDYFRGTRNGSTFDLVKDYSSMVLTQRFRASFYRSQAISRLQELVVPSRFIETFSLLHVKLYRFDDTVILTGANLASDYFTSRQDRYIVVKDNAFACYVQRVFSVFENSAFRLTDGDLVEPKAYNTDSWIQNQRTSLKLLNEDFKSKVSNDGKFPILVPHIHSKFLGIETEAEMLKVILQQAASSGAKLVIATAYFNLPSDIQEVIALNKSSNYLIMVAAPSANSFYNSKGLSKFVPKMYDNLLFQFMTRFPFVHVLEYAELNRSWHCKGVWLSNTAKKSAITLIGSSNYNYRSMKRDIEFSVLLKAGDSKIGKMLCDETFRLSNNCQVVSKNQIRKRIGGLWIRLATRIFRSML